MREVICSVDPPTAVAIWVFKVSEVGRQAVFAAA